MADRRRSGTWQLAVMAFALGTPSLALAWHIEGRVVCDSNGNGIIDGNDEAPNGIVVRITALTASPGTIFDFTTSGGNGFYYVTLPDRADDYRVELQTGLPPGASIVVPASGAYGEPPTPPIALTPAFKHATEVNFILDGCGGAPTRIPSSTPTPTAVETPPSTPIVVATPTSTDLATATPTATPSDQPTFAATPTMTPTDEPTATATATPPAPSATPTPTSAPSETASATPALTATPPSTTTPQRTATAGPSPSVTPVVPTGTATPSPATTPGDVFPNHFQCYEIDRTTLAAIKDLPVEDRFGATTIDIGGSGRVKRLCNPADKRGEDPTAPTDPDHLVGYVIGKRSPRVRSYPDQIVENQFGTTRVSLTRPILLLVPSAKSLSAPPAAPAQPAVDHFQCYGVTNAQTRIDRVPVVDQFGALTLDVKRPSRLCVAADKRGEGVLAPAAALMCYEVRSSSGTPRFTGPGGPVYVANQFGPDTLKVTRPTELCVPSSVTEAPARRRGVH